MHLYKFKIDKSSYAQGSPIIIDSEFNKGHLVEVRGVFYGSKSPQSNLLLLDADGDMFMFPIAGTSLPKVVSPDVAPIAKLPFYYIDTSGDNEIIIWGIAHRIGS